MNMIPDNVVDSIEISLARLAYWWRGSDSIEEKEVLEKQYNELLMWLLKWGWTDTLDPDSELPDHCLVEEYKKHRGF